MLRITGLIMIMGLVLFIACADKPQTETVQDSQSVQQDSVKKVYYYTCPMEEHKHIAGDKEGKCPECNMVLVAMCEAPADSAESHGCPMASHSHIRHDKPGKCEECNMDLKPMKQAGACNCCKMKKSA